LTPSPVLTGGSLPDYVLPARPSTSDDARVAVELALQPFGTPVNSESSGNGLTPEPTLTSSNYGTFRVSVSESRKRRRQREILDYVLVPAPPILRSPFSRVTSFRSPKTRMLHRDQMVGQPTSELYLILNTPFRWQHRPRTVVETSRLLSHQGNPNYV